MSWFDQNLPPGQTSPNDSQGGPNPPPPNGGSPLTRTPQAAPSAGATGFQFDPTKNPTDPAYVRQFVDYLATLPNADPQLKNDPDYYVKQIIANGGGVTQDNANYWQAHVTNPANYTPGGGGGGAANSQLATLENTPGYQFTLGQGIQALDRTAAAKGTLLTGGTVKAAERYGAGLASQTYQNAVNNALGLYQTGLNAVNSSTQ